MPVRVALADDHVMFRDGLRILLEKNGVIVVGEAENGAKAVDVVRRCRPQIVVMDLSMPVMNGIEAASEILREWGTPTILLTVHSEEMNVQRAFEAGVAGYVLKTKASCDLMQAILEVNRGNVYLSPGISRGMVREMLNRYSGAADVLSLRERQVLQLIVQGKTGKELSRLLGFSMKTASAHRAHIMEKLEIRETAGLVRYAIREGLIEP